MREQRFPGLQPSIRGFFPQQLEADFAAFQRANPRFALQRLDGDEVARIIHFCKHPDAEATTDADQDAKAAAAEKYVLRGDRLYIAARTATADGGDSRGVGRVTRSGVLQRRRVVHNANDVFQICALAHLTLQHGHEGATAREVRQLEHLTNLDLDIAVTVDGVERPPVRVGQHRPRPLPRPPQLVVGQEPDEVGDVGPGRTAEDDVLAAHRAADSARRADSRDSQRPYFLR